jgi:hypothetical protein
MTANLKNFQKAINQEEWHLGAVVVVILCAVSESLKL